MNTSQVAPITSRPRKFRHFAPVAGSLSPRRHPRPRPLAATIARPAPAVSSGSRYLRAFLTVLALLAAVMLLCGTAHAADAAGATVLPYETWLKTLQKSLTGPVAFSVALIGIVTSGATLILGGGQIGNFVRSLVFLILVMSLLVGANSLMSRLFNGAEIAARPAISRTLDADSPMLEAMAPESWTLDLVRHDLPLVRRCEVA